MARMVLSVWAVSDRYRMLIALGRSAPGEEGFRTTLAPIRAETTSILVRGQREGVIADHLPAPVLAQALQFLILALIEAQDPAGWNDPTGEATAAATFVTVGLTPAQARDRVRTALAQLAAP